MMQFPFERRARQALLSLTAIAGFLSAPLLAETQAPTPAPASQPQQNTPWLYRNSDVPQDKAWTFGELDNGLRYAVRRNGVPPGQVSIRIRIDAGSLMENEGEQGFAHFLEHLAFRGSRNVPEGESKRIWQRLGATFGSDSNASTTPTETVYKLDLPNARPEGLDESLKILAGMMDAPNIDAATVESERAVVMAEQREQYSPAAKIGDAVREHFFHGQKLATRPTIGTSASLAGASAAALKAFHDRWYRPERAVVVIAGDADPAMLEALVKKHFAAWKGAGPAPTEPDFGRPDPKAPATATVVEPSFPTMLQLAYMRAWEPVDDTIVYNEGLMIDALAIRMINRRLEARARQGGSFLQAQVQQQDISRSADATMMSLVPLGDDWQAALRDVRGVIADAMTQLPDQADIDREIEEFDVLLLGALENQGAEPGAKQADNLVSAVDIRETVTTPEGALQIFRNARPRFTPANLLASTQKLFSGVGPKILLTTPQPLANADALLAAALAEDIQGSGAKTAARTVTFDDLPRLGKAAKVVSRSTLPSIAIETVTLSNGVKLLLFPNKGEPGRIYVAARFGNGYQALPADRETVAWASDLALVGSGIGSLGLDELDRLTNGRKINLSIGIEENAFVMKGETRAPDLADQLRLMATKLSHPGWDPAPVIRARAQMLASYDIMSASASAVISRDLDALLRGGDPRWQSPDRASIAALTPEAFRALWEPLLKTGPIEVQIFGDFESDAAIDAAARSFGALKERKPAPVNPGSARTRTPEPTAKPVIRHHTGPEDQAAAVIAWPTGGGLDAISESRKLEVLAAIFNDRLFDQLRATAGASYSPSVFSQWPTGMENGGAVIALGQLKPDAIDQFFTLSRAIAADLIAKPVDADELERALGPIKQFYLRASTGNLFWMRETAGATRDPRKFAAMESLPTDLARITPAQIQATAARYLTADRSWALAVLPESRTTAGR